MQILFRRRVINLFKTTRSRTCELSVWAGQSIAFSCLIEIISGRKEEAKKKNKIWICKYAIRWMEYIVLQTRSLIYSKIHVIIFQVEREQQN